MGMTEVALKVKNLRYPSKVFEGIFLVDSGAAFTVVPESILKKIGIKPQHKETFSLADGRLIERKVGSALYEFEGKEAAAPILFGEKDDSLLLGTFTLEALGLTLDPFKRKLYKAILRM